MNLAPSITFYCKIYFYPAIAQISRREKIERFCKLHKPHSTGYLTKSVNLLQYDLNNGLGHKMKL